MSGKLFPIVVLVVAGFGLSACGTIDRASRAEPIDLPMSRSQATAWTVTDVQVNVSRELRVSEANSYYPIADIVWRGDPRGNRYEQVATLMDEGLSAGVAQLRGGRPVILRIDVKRFHSVTEKVRYTVGGTHSIKFDMVVVDAQTGVPLTERRRIKADINALGGQEAIEAESRGITQKTRIRAHLADLIRRELAAGMSARV